MAGLRPGHVVLWEHTGAAPLPPRPQWTEPPKVLGSTLEVPVFAKAFTRAAKTSREEFHDKQAIKKDF